jgi:hypothetical protein
MHSLEQATLSTLTHAHAHLNRLAQQALHAVYQREGCQVLGCQHLQSRQERGAGISIPQLIRKAQQVLHRLVAACVFDGAMRGAPSMQGQQKGTWRSTSTTMRPSMSALQ